MKARLVIKTMLELDVDLSKEKFDALQSNLPLHPNDLEEYGLEQAVWDSGVLEYATSAVIIDIKQRK